MLLTVLLEPLAILRSKYLVTFQNVFKKLPHKKIGNGAGYKSRTHTSEGLREVSRKLMYQ